MTELTITTAELTRGSDPAGKAKVHYLPHLKNQTVCGKEPTTNWSFGIEKPPSNFEYWCRKCFPDDFILIRGLRIHFDD